MSNTKSLRFNAENPDVAKSGGKKKQKKGGGRPADRPAEGKLDYPET